MRERQEKEDNERLVVQVERVPVHLDCGQAVRVSQHTALRRPRGAGCVDDRRGLLGPSEALDVLERVVRHRGGVFAQADQGESGLVAAPEGDDVFEARARVSDLIDLEELILVLAEDETCARMLEHVAALLGGVRVIDRDNDGPGAERAAVGERPLGTRRREHGDPVPGLDAERDQATSDLFHHSAKRFV